MKRTGEKILGWIGVGVNIIVAILTGLVAVLYSSLLNSAEFQGLESEIANDPALSAEEAEMINMMLTMGSTFIVAIWFGVAVMVIGTVLAIIASIKVGTNAKTAGILFVVTGGVLLLLTVGTSLIQSILFIIAGIMCLARKPPVEPEPLEETRTEF